MRSSGRSASISSPGGSSDVCTGPASETSCQASAWRVRGDMSWEPVIGLEIHTHLKTRTKMFCRCETGFGAPPNTHTCPVCLAHPGALPVPNERAVEWTIRLGLALGCDVARHAIFHRKNYFYPDN